MSIPERPGAGNDKWVGSALLAGIPGLLHGFTTRAAGDLSHPETGEAIGRALGATRLRLLRQVHGVHVASPESRVERPQADGWAGRPPAGMLLGVLTADCLPVLLCHPPTRALGLAHAGWRGAVAGVVIEVLEAMGVAAGEVVTALGPCIRSCCYQVGEDVAEAVGRGSARLTRWPDACDRYRLDLPGLVRDQLTSVGVPPASVEVLPFCTACRPDLFYSYRRARSRGRMCGFLGWGIPRGGR